MSSWKVIFATLVIFAAGLVVGGLVVNKTGGTAPATPRPPGAPSGTPTQFRLQSLLGRMHRELALTPDQETQIRNIIYASQERASELWKPVAQEMGKETQDACEQIRSVLTPEQQVKFDNLPKSRPGPGERGERGGERGGPWRRGPGGPTNRFPTNVPH